MIGAQVVSLDGPDGVRVHDVGPVPAARPGEVLVDVHAVGLSYPDLLMSSGSYQLKPDLPFVLGVDFSGVVREAAEGFGVGDRVAGWSSHGSAAEVVSVPPERLFPLPSSLSLVQGAAMPLNYLTAHFALVTRGGASAGETVVITGAGGGVGSASVQVARGLGLTTIGVVAREVEGDYARAAGADHVLVGADAKRVRELTDGRGADLVLDVVGSEQIVLESLRCLALRGRLLSLGYVAGEIPTVRLNRLLLNNTDVRGVAWGPYARAMPGHARWQWTALAEMAGRGHVAPDVRQVRPLSGFAEAMKDMRERRTVGKTVLTVR